MVYIAGVRMPSNRTDNDSIPPGIRIPFPCNGQPVDVHVTELFHSNLPLQLKVPFVLIQNAKWESIHWCLPLHKVVHSQQESGNVLTLAHQIQLNVQCETELCSLFLPNGILSWDYL
jgi:hypothetical protein